MCGAVFSDGKGKKMNKCDFCIYRWSCKEKENGICLRDEERKDDEKERRIQQSKSDMGD